MKMRSRALGGGALAASLLVVGIIAASCGGAPSGPNGGPCSSDAQCSAPTPYCGPGVCVQCLSDPNCANNQNGNTICNPNTHTCVECATNAQCGGGQPYCSPTGRCVQCLANTNCGANQACNAATHECVPTCTSDQQCAAPTPYCNTSFGYCVQCLGNANCTDPQRPLCDTTTGLCVECASNADCKDAQQPLCDTANHQCVQCLVNADCGANGVCSLDHTCR